MEVVGGKGVRESAKIGWERGCEAARREGGRPSRQAAGETFAITPRVIARGSVGRAPGE